MAIYPSHLGPHQIKDWHMHDTEVMEMAAQCHPLAIHWVQGFRGYHINHSNHLEIQRVNRSMRDTLEFHDSRVLDIPNYPFNPKTYYHVSTFTLFMTSRWRRKKWRKYNSKHPTMKHLQLSEDEFSSSEDDSIKPLPTRKTKTIDNILHRKTNNVKGAKPFPFRAATSPG